MLLRIAQSAGLSEAQFDACVKDKAALTALAERVQTAQDQTHILATPTFLVDGKMLPPGEKTLAQLDARHPAVAPMSSGQT